MDSVRNGAAPIFKNDDNNQNAQITDSHPGIKRRSGFTKNLALKKKKDKGQSLDIQFPPQFKKVCGIDSSIFKAEVGICISQHSPPTIRWREVDDNIKEMMWIFLKNRLNLSDNIKYYVMKQCQRQFVIRHSRLHQLYLLKKPCPKYVDEDEWNWLITNKWNSEKFKKISAANQLNRTKVKLQSITGTKSIIQTAYEMKEKSESKSWPSRSELWKATQKKKNGDWANSDGEETLGVLEDIGLVYANEISSSPVPLITHFGYVLGRGKGGYARGLGIGGINKNYEEKAQLQANAEDANKRVDIMENEIERLNGVIKNQEDNRLSLQEQIDDLKKQLEESLHQQQSQSSSNMIDVSNMVRAQLDNLLPKYTGHFKRNMEKNME